MGKGKKIELGGRRERPIRDLIDARKKRIGWSASKRRDESLREAGYAICMKREEGDRSYFPRITF